MHVLILSDIHANYQSLTAVLKSAKDVDAIFCLGDIVLFGSNPVARIDLIRTKTNQIVCDNHDVEIVQFCRQSTVKKNRDALAMFEKENIRSQR